MDHIHGAVLSDKTIKSQNKKGLLIEQPLRPEQIQPNSVDLTLAASFKKLKPNASRIEARGDKIKFVNHPMANVINPKIPAKFIQGMFTEDGEGGRFYLLEPGEFVLMASREILNIPKGIIGFVCGRSSVARLAIQSEQAGLVDGGFRGTITFEVTNQSEYPIVLWEGMRFAQVYFLYAEEPDVAYGSEISSKYNDQIAATESRLHLDAEFMKCEYTETEETDYGSESSDDE